MAALFFRSGVMKITDFDMTQMLFFAHLQMWHLWHLSTEQRLA